MADVAGTYIDTIVAFASAVSEPPKVATTLISTPGTLSVTQQYLMQAWDSITNTQYDWLVPQPDFAGAYYPGPNSPVNIAVAGILLDCP